jgi:uncharacterized membrane protein YdjX (TVP38/TMEM64 family)
MQAPTTPSPGKGSLGLKIALALVAVAMLVAAWHFLPVGDWLRHFQKYVRSAGAIGYVIYVLVYAACCILFVPASILTLGAGAIFGLAGGTVVVVIGATLGATLSFALARGLMRKRVEAMIGSNARFQALDRAIAREGAKIVLLVRLAPIFPFTYVNYAFGLTGLRIIPYAAATLIGIIPGTLAYTYLGYAAVRATTGGSSTKTIIQIGGAAAAIVVTLFVARLATRAIRRAGVGEGVGEGSGS